MKAKPTAIATLGSHCALQVLKGAKDEGFKTLLVCEKRRVSLYKRFSFVDDMIIVDSFRDILEKGVQKKLAGAVVIPHGTLISQMSSDEIESINAPIFGNKWILRWEADREMKQRLMEEAGLKTPRQVKSKHDIAGLCIVKLHGAAGGRGYYLAWDRKSFEEGAKRLVEQEMIEGEQDLYIQEFIRGCRPTCSISIRRSQRRWSFWASTGATSLTLTASGAYLQGSRWPQAASLPILSSATYRSS